MYKNIIALEPITTTYFVNPSHKSLCQYVYIPIISHQKVNQFFQELFVFYVVQISLFLSDTFSLMTVFTRINFFSFP
jgi:hypothetical protein